MKKNHLIMAMVLFCICGASALMTSCQTKNAGIRLVAGTLDEVLPADTAPQHVQDAFVKAVKVHPFEILNDEANNINVVGIGEVDTTSAEGYGIMITKNAISTTFLNIRNVRQPVARYDSATGNLWLTSSAMEGSGVRVEWLYQIRFGDNDLAYVAAVLNPYDVQQALCQRLGYTIDGDTVTLYSLTPDRSPKGEGSDNSLQQEKHSAPLAFWRGAGGEAAQMGGFDDDQPLWIGEQLFYDLSGDSVCLQVVPGVKFSTGPVLAYDDMPTLSVPVTIGSDGTPAFGEINIAAGDEATDTELDTYLKAIDRYFIDSVGPHYGKGELCIPNHTIVAVDEQDAADIKVWGDFWVFNYNLVGDTLKCVSGGSHPGLAHVQQTEGHFQVTGFDAVEDGSRYLPTAQKIFGDKFNDFQRIASDEKAREAVRTEAIAAYVEQHNLNATMYQDYGWDAVKFK